MANRSYLFSLDKNPDLQPRAVGLSESEANIPLIYRILVSQNPQATKSILFGEEEKIAVTADFEAGVQKLESFFEKLPDEYRERCDTVLSFLHDEKNAQKFIHLECAEIYEMEGGDLESQNAALIAELADIDGEIQKALNRILNDGDSFDLRELDAEYWTNTLFFCQKPRT